MLVDQFLPVWDVRSRHGRSVAADPARVFAALRGLDLSRSRVVRWLFRLRGMPTAAMTLDGLERFGFIPLAEEVDREIVLGLVGRFWTRRGGLRRLSPEAFRAFAEPGFAKAVWSFAVTPVAPGRSRLETETRVRCTDRRSRRRFRLYWLLIAPFSGWIRREALRLAKSRAEWPDQPHASGLPTGSGGSEA